MKVIVLLSLIVALSAAQNDIAPQDEIDFQEWKIKFNKSYDSDAKEQEALSNFVTAMREIEEHNRKFEKGEVSYRMSLNKFADISESERNSFVSGFQSSSFKIESRSITTVTPGMFPKGPATFNWRARGKITPVKDQSFYCNNCWAFSALGALEAHYSIYFNIKTPLSEQQLIDCNRNELAGNWGCKGGSQSSAYMYIRDVGISSMADYPYDETYAHNGTFPCRYNSSKSVGRTTGYYRIRPFSEDLLKDVIASVGPAAFAMDSTSKSFMYYTDGIYDEPNCGSKLSHSAVIVGYGTDIIPGGKSVDYWLCKNSWSTDWGSKYESFVNDVCFN